MLPETSTTENINGLLDSDIMTSKSYRMKIEAERVDGDIDNLEAVAQAAYKAINTERYAYVIYSWDYGIELKDLLGKPIPYVFAVLPDRLKSCLMQDDRIESIDGFDLSHDGKGNVSCKFTIHSTYGSIDLVKEVKIW